MDVEQQKRYQLENLGIVRKDEVSQGQCLNPHVDLALSVSRFSPLATSVEVSAWNAFESNDPDPDGNCEGLDRIAGGNLHRMRILSNMDNKISSRGTEREYKHRHKQKSNKENSGENNSGDTQQTSGRLKSTPLSSSSSAYGIAAVLPVDWKSSSQVLLPSQIHGQNSSYLDDPIKATSRSHVFESQMPQGLSDPHDFMAAVSKASFIVPKDPTTTDNSNMRTLWSANQDLIDLDFGDTVEQCSSGFNSSAWSQKSNQLNLATELPFSSPDTDTTIEGQSFSSISSNREQHNPVNLISNCSSRKYDAEFLKQFSSIRTLFKPFRPDAEPIIRNQAHFYLPSMPIRPLLNLSSDETNSEREWIGLECSVNPEASAIINSSCVSDPESDKYSSNKIVEKSAIRGNLMDSKYAH